MDVDGRSPNPTTKNFIAPALQAARASEMLVNYVHNDLRLVADPGNIVGEIWGKTKGGSGGNGIASWARQEYKPEYLDYVAPR